MCSCVQTITAIHVLFLFLSCKRNIFHTKIESGNMRHYIDSLCNRKKEEEEEEIILEVHGHALLSKYIRMEATICQ